MKRTITGWMPTNFKGEPLTISGCSQTQLSDSDIPITITYDDGKPETKTVYEWMYFDDVWCVSDALLDEAAAAKAFDGFPHKKLREFQVEVNDAE